MSNTADSLCVDFNRVVCSGAHICMFLSTCATPQVLGLLEEMHREGVEADEVTPPCILPADMVVIVNSVFSALASLGPWCAAFEILIRSSKREPI